ncbi:hypothetical protein [Burkholderia sp. 22313]|uniref:hypothetical protein n=1 Tax=Burkholderia sp. 22313 TaxID=3453908 RepID=UPI002BC7EB1A|nr:hypothetical protein [Burkholderia sp.]
MTLAAYRGWNAGARPAGAIRRAGNRFPGRPAASSCLTAVFFWSRPASTHELLLIYFFVRWLDRQPDGGREVAPPVTEQVNRGGQIKCAESTAF